MGTPARGAVYGPMAEVVYDSLQYLSQPDIEAMAVYLKSLPSRAGATQRAPPVSASESSLLTSLWPESGALRRLPWKGRQRDAARLSSAGQQSVDSDDIRGEADTHGAERRIPLWYRGKPDAIRHAAVRAELIG
jgi:hypothetical protein